MKALKTAEDTVREAAMKAFDEQLKALVDGLNETAEEIRAPRLELEKLISKRKDEVKSDLIRQAMDNLICAPRMRQAVYGKSVADAIKGKRSFDGMSKALETIVTIHNGTIRKNREMIESFQKTHSEELVMDSEELETKSPDSVEAELRRRFDMKKAADERKRLEAEAAAARAAEAKAKADAEAACKGDEPANVVPMKGTTAPDPLPAAPKIGSIPTGPSPLAEWAAWITACKTTFGALKAARDGLKHPENIRRAAILANGVNAAWVAMKEDGKEVES